jgi:hypothetical protein
VSFDVQNARKAISAHEKLDVAYTVERENALGLMLPAGQEVDK